MTFGGFWELQSSPVVCLSSGFFFLAQKLGEMSFMGNLVQISDMDIIIMSDTWQTTWGLINSA